MIWLCQTNLYRLSTLFHYIYKKMVRYIYIKVGDRNMRGKFCFFVNRMIGKVKSVIAFTTAELLIVVAIVGVLVAISIPILNKNFEKARETADVHTMRAVASLAFDYYLSGVKDKDSAEAAGLAWWNGGNSIGSQASNANGVYNPGTGKFVAGYAGAREIGLKPYGKGTKLDGGTGVIRGYKNFRVYDPALDYTHAVLQIAIYPKGEYLPDGTGGRHIEIAWRNLDNNGNQKQFTGNGSKGTDMSGNYTDKLTDGERHYPMIYIPIP